MRYTNQIKHMKKLEKAYCRIKESLSEAEGGLTVHLTDNRLYVEVSTGRTFGFSKKEIAFQADMYDTELEEAQTEAQNDPSKEFCYESFLFSQLFMNYVGNHKTQYKDLEYDLIFPEVLKHEELYKSSTYFLGMESEYECILKYLSNEVI